MKMYLREDTIYNWYSYATKMQAKVDAHKDILNFAVNGIAQCTKNMTWGNHPYVINLKIYLVNDGSFKVRFY